MVDEEVEGEKRSLVWVLDSLGYAIVEDFSRSDYFCFKVKKNRKQKPQKARRVKM
jgi:hypothetical protein